MDIIGKKIIKMRYQSFYLDFKQVCKIIALYIKLDNNNWYKLTSGDGKSIFEVEENEPYTNKGQKLVDEFEYPINDLNLDSLSRFGEIQKLEEYIWLGKKDESCGFLISFKNDRKLSIYEKDDCLYLELGEVEFLLKNCITTTLTS